MNRLTKKSGNSYFVENDKIEHEDNGYSGEAVTRLAGFENMYYDLILRQTQLSRELDKLKLEGKTHSVKFKQLLTEKITNNNIIILFESNLLG